ncbi:hypothetical protein NON08_06000 [Cetobacterium somerae]|uniref:MurR/RpiR family transcriptional regulator n=1 Tax=Cetobacterium sp. NK01 TaxID=2993530 RepID=UPI002116C502|nr:hypothetical protein [Cetobacterium sp. NK01]MCQ8212076.1 hypothetical protein [Cetobacterium sp. NK01]
MFFLKVEGIEDELTKSEKKLVEYIKENLVLVKKYNVMDLADKSGVSAPSIIRLAKKLGYSGFLDMKIDLNKSRDYLAEDNTFLEKLLDSFKDKIFALPPTVTLENILVIAKYIKNSDRVMLICEGEFLNLERFVYSKLLTTGKNIFLNLGEESSLKVIETFKKDDVVLVLSGTISKSVRNIFESNKDKGLNTIFIGERLKNDDRALLDVDLDLQLSIEDSYFIYALILENILNLI